MSIRYGILVVPEPSFTARAYRARQIICGQYGSWAAEMHMVHIPVVEYFQCPAPALTSIDAGLAEIARQSRRENFLPLGHRGVAVSPDVIGNIFLDFAIPENPVPRALRNLLTLHHNVVDLLQGTSGPISDPQLSEGSYHPHLPLMQHAKLRPAVFSDAVEFARGVVRDLQMPDATHAWRLLLAQFQSGAADAAPDGWERGLWAADLRWEVLASHPL